VNLQNTQCNNKDNSKMAFAYIKSP